MTGASYTMQRGAAMATVAPVPPAMPVLDLAGHGSGTIATPWNDGITGTAGFTAKRAARHLGSRPT